MIGDGRHVRSDLVKNFTAAQTRPGPQPIKPSETLRLPAQLLRAVEQYAKYLGGSTDRTYVITQAVEITLRQDADFQTMFD